MSQEYPTFFSIKLLSNVRFVKEKTGLVVYQFLLVIDAIEHTELCRAEKC